ncbi:hypothetical protein [Neodiprion abietis nucleopolyhedrovirus]|uniref:Uncharacterized protein n=1 Tax=Neodiprion abietis nucleopolyhedrovirus TaxID=204507 RepID=Q0ZNZ8_9CBAC|nr:hypothetical protein [Neodiprion abietis nucleopolyhedrovirus]ABC74956.1 unknown [Neodiprion abietis nucleopolyhedrovirus]
MMSRHKHHFVQNDKWRKIDKQQHLYQLLSVKCYRKFHECRICLSNVLAGKIPLIAGNRLLFTSFICHNCVESGLKYNPDFLTTDIYRSRVIQWFDYPFDVSQCQKILNINPNIMDNDECLQILRKCQLDSQHKYVFDDVAGRIKRIFGLNY